MPEDNTDFDSIFAEATAEVEAGGGVDASAETKKQNAKIHLGDGEVIDPQATGDEDEGDETDDSDESTDDDEESFEDETSEGDEDDDEDNQPEFDIASHKDELVKVKVDGQEVSVPLGEALNGYMRQADYTRKTQQVAELKAAAEWGKSMRDALLEDPEGVIAALADSFGIQLGAHVESEDDPYTTDDPELQPILQKMKQLEERNSMLEKRLETKDQLDMNAQVRQEVAALAAKYPDFDPHKVLPLVIEAKGAVGIEQAYFMVKGQEAEAAAAAEAAKTAKAREAAAKEAKKRKLNKAVTNGKRNVTATGAKNTGDSFEDMLTFELDLAKR